MPFRTVNPKINQYCRESAHNTSDMIMMVVLSIQQPWHSVGKQMRDYRALGESSRFVWGNKLKTYHWLQINKENLYRDVMDATDDEELMKAFLCVPGLGLAKAGFCCQLFAGRVGCIDVHNLRRLKIAASVLNLDKKSKPATQKVKIQAYIQACKQRRTSWLWDSWCKLIAGKDPKRWVDGEHVSMAHLQYLVEV